MTTPLVLRDIRLEHRDHRMILSGQVDTTPLFWNMPESDAIAVRAEPFIAASLVSAMQTGRDIVLPAGVPADRTFLDNVEEIQSIFARWFPGLQHVRIEVPDVAPRAVVRGRYTGYSGGVDSSFTVMKLQGNLDGAVLVDGIDYGEPNPALMTEVDGALRHAVEMRGLPLVRIQTNAKAVGKHLGGKWAQFIGGTLASAPHALGAARYWIAGSNSWENARPYGTHPYTDPLWSSSSVHIQHHGADARRIDKIAALRDAPDLLAVLRVCFQGDNYNCGACHKCVQTTAAMRALQISSPVIPPLDDPRALRRMHVEHDGDLVDWAEILVPGLQLRDPALYREMRRLLRRYGWRQLARVADQTVLSGWLHRRNRARRET